MNTLDYVVEKFGVDVNQRSPIELPISRNGLAKLFCDLRFRHIAEIGTERGLYARALARYNPEAKIYRHYVTTRNDLDSNVYNDVYKPFNGQRGYPEIPYCDLVYDIHIFYQ